MKTKTLLLAGMLALTALPAAAQDFRLRSARVGGPDYETVKKQAEFYKKTFGLMETGRADRPADGFLEVIMNYGATPEAARLALTPKVVVITAPKGTVFPHPTSNLIFEVADARGVAERAVASGGKVTLEMRPSRNPNSRTALVGFVADPAGNRIEIIELKK